MESGTRPAARWRSVTEGRSAMFSRPTRSIAAAFAVAAIALAGATPAAFARHGNDDPVSHDRGNDHGGKRVHAARHGKDDPAGDDHGRHGRGNDDPAGDDRGGR